jgi:methionyl-tRNA formyltransferase
METKNDKKFRVILLTHGGAGEVLSGLAALKNVNVVGVFIETERNVRRAFSEKIKRSMRYDGFWATLRKVLKTKTEEIAEDDGFERTACELGVPVYFVRNYHDADAVELIKNADTDLGVIFGTNIIRENVFSIPRLGSINLHQGLAPFYRGSAPVFWELFNDEPEVGVTVHRVAAKVDAGDIVMQRRVPLRYDFARYDLDFQKFIADFRANLKELCAALVAESVRQIAAGAAVFQPQDLSQGKRYKLPTKHEKDLLRRKLRERKKIFNAETRRRGENLENLAKSIFLFFLFFSCLCVFAFPR